MAITNATRLADFGSGIGTQGAAFEVDNTQNRVGLGTTNPQKMVQVGQNLTMDDSGINLTGVITATTFVGSFGGVGLGDGNVNAGIATFSGVVSVGGTLTYEDVTNVDSVGIVTGGLGLRVSSGGIQAVGLYTGFKASGVATFASTIDADGIIDAASDIRGSGNFNAAGITTLTGHVSTGTTVGAGGSIYFADNKGINFGNAAEGDLQIYHNGSHSYALNSTGQFILAGDEVLLKGGGNSEVGVKYVKDGAVTLYYDDSLKLETTTDGAVTTGIHTVTVGTDLDGFKVEEGKYDTDALNGEFDFELENGHIQTHTGSTAGTYFPDFRVSSGTSLSSVMGVGDVVSCTLIVAASNTAHYCTTGIKIDNSTSNVTIEWIGSSAPSAGKGAGYDIYAFTIQKTAATPAYLVIVNATDAG